MTDPITTDDPPQTGATEATMHAALLGQMRERLGVQTDEEVLAALDQIRADREAAEAAERNQLFADAIAARRLTPALRDQLAAKPIAEIKRFLGAMPTIIPGAINQPSVPSVRASKGAKSAPMLGWNGKAWTELKPSERAQLKRDDFDLYNAMRSEALAEGNQP